MTKDRLRSMKQPYAATVEELRARLYQSAPRNEQEPDLPPLLPGERPQDPWLDGRDMRFEGYRIKTLEQGGEYPDTMPEVIEVTDAEGRKALYTPLSRDGKVVRSAGVVDALERCGAIEALTSSPDADDSGTMKQYRSRTEVFEAVQITDHTFDAPHPNPELVVGVIYSPTTRTAEIETDAGPQTAAIGDWIIRKSGGQLYRMSSDAFEALFEPLDAA